MRSDDLAILEPELGLEALHVERGSWPAPRESRRGLPGQCQWLADRAGWPRPAAEDIVELLVVESGVRAHQAAIEARRQRLAPLRDLDLGGDGETVLVGDEAADVTREDLRQHRRDPPRDVGGIGAAAGLLLEGAPGADVRGDVGDVDPEAKAAVRSRR